MPANAALTATELTRLASSEQDAPVYLDYEPDTTVGTAEVAITPSSGLPVALITTTSESAGWANVRQGQTYKITNSTGGVLRGYYRVRLAPSGHSAYIGESMDADTGLLAAYNRTAAIQAGDIITAIERYDLWSVKPYRAFGNSALNQDYGILVGSYNQYGQIIANMAINSQPGDYMAQVANAATKAISATVSVIKWPPLSGSIVGYSWSYPASFTGVSGGSTATLTATAPIGSHRIYCTITDSIGGAITITRRIRIYSPANPPLDGIITADTADRQSGRRMTIRLTQSTVSVIPPAARCTVWSPATWGGLDVDSARHSFTGFVINQPFSHKPGYHESQINIEGPAGVLARLRGYPAAFNYTGTTATWENLAATLSNLHFMQWWILRWRCANVLETFNFTPLDTTGTTKRRFSISINPGNIWRQLKQIADSGSMNIASRSDGEIIVRDLPYLLEDRSGLVTRGTLTNSIYSSIGPAWERRPKVGHMRLDAVTSDLTADTKIASEAPAVDASAQGADDLSVSDLTCESQTDANQKCGRFYIHASSEYPQDQLEIPQNWDVFEPADCQRIVQQIPANRSPTGIAISLNRLINNVTKYWLLGRRAKIQIQVEAETDGLPGKTAPIETQVASNESNNITPPVDGGGNNVTHNGTTVYGATLTNVYSIRKYGASSLGTDVTGGGIVGSIHQFYLDPFSPLLSEAKTGALGCWVATANASGGLFYCPNILAASRVWTLKLAFDCANVQIRPSALGAGIIYVAYAGAATFTAGTVTCKKLSSYGSVTDWSQAVGSGHNTQRVALDIDPFTDHVLVSGPDGATNEAVYRIDSGGAPVKLAGTSVTGGAGGAIRWLQRPLLNLSGGTNSTDAAEVFYFTDIIGNKLYKTVNQGTSKTDITPIAGFSVSEWGRSIAPVDDASELFAPNYNTGHMYHSVDAGATWTDLGAVDSNIYTSGIFPRRVNGKCLLYAGGSSTFWFSDDGGVSWVNANGNLSPSSINSAIPVY